MAADANHKYRPYIERIFLRKGLGGPSKLTLDNKFLERGNIENGDSVPQRCSLYGNTASFSRELLPLK